MISIQLSARVPNTPTAAGSLTPETYRHEITTSGGFKSAQFTTAVSKVEAIRWMDGGLAMGVVAKNERGSTVWEGFVNKINIRNGPNDRTLGPVMDISNHVSVSYSTPTYAGLSKSYKRNTPYVTDLESEAKYGLLSEVVSGSELSDKAAIAYGHNYLADNAVPNIMDKTNRNAEVTGYHITVECLGWSRYLEKAHYLYKADYDQQPIYKKIDLVLSRGLFARRVGYYTTEVSRSEMGSYVEGWEDRNRACFSVIDEAVNQAVMGSDSRPVWGMFADKKFVVKVSRNSHDRYERSFEYGDVTEAGVLVPNSEVLPGKWIALGGLMDAVVYYVDSVAYDMVNNDLTTNFTKRTIQAALTRRYGI